MSAAPPGGDRDPAEAVRLQLVEAFFAGCAAMDPEALVLSALPSRPPRNARVRVIAAGKAAPAMARGALRRWPDEIADALVVTVEGADRGAAGQGAGRTTLLAAGHPLPDARGLAAAEEALRRAKDLGARGAADGEGRVGDGLLLALISGGCSALLTAPPAGLELDEKRALVAEMLERGAPITEVNLVRRHLSRVKGGRLLAAAFPARVLTLALSDVIGGGDHDIGSGPSVFDPTTRDQARAALRRWAPRLADRIEPLLEESIKPELGIRARCRILAGPADLGAAVARELERAGLAARVLAAEEGDAAAMAERRVAQALALRPGDAAVIPCEPTLSLPAAHGRGGRAGRVALLAALRLPPDVALLCGASDGVDGSSGCAGAAVTRGAASRTTPEAITLALEAFDDARLHASIGTSIAAGPSGTNLTDVHILARLGGRGAI